MALWRRMPDFPLGTGQRVLTLFLFTLFARQGVWRFRPLIRRIQEGLVYDAQLPLCWTPPLWSG